jgi:hypothetical protein
LVFAVNLVPNSELVTTTRTSGTTAFEASATVPVMLALSAWANSMPTHKAGSNNTAKLFSAILERIFPSTL